MTAYPYPDDPGQTHYDGCWRERGHHNCAMREVERLQNEVKDLQSILDTDPNEEAFRVIEEIRRNRKPIATFTVEIPLDRDRPP